MPQRLTLESPSLFPVQAFFNSVADMSFVRVVDCLTSGVGYSIDEADCTFPGDLDPGDEPFDGVRFTLFEDTAIISLSQLRQYLSKVSHDYVVSNPQDEATLAQLLARPV